MNQSDSSQPTVYFPSSDKTTPMLTSNFTFEIQKNFKHQIPMCTNQNKNGHCEYFLSYRNIALSQRYASTLHFEVMFTTNFVAENVSFVQESSNFATDKLHAGGLHL
jgi:hypothetical protein